MQTVDRVVSVYLFLCTELCKKETVNIKKNCKEKGGSELSPPSSALRT